MKQEVKAGDWNTGTHSNKHKQQSDGPAPGQRLSSNVVQLSSKHTVHCAPSCLFVLGAKAPAVRYGLLIHDVSRSHTTTHHSRQDSSGRVISSSQRLLSDNTQHSQQTDIHAPGWIWKHTISAGDRPQTYALDRATTGTGVHRLEVFENHCFF